MSVQDEARKRAIVRELGVLSENEKQAIPGRTLVEFLRTRVSDASACEVQEEIKGLMQGRVGGADVVRNQEIVALRAGAVFGGGKTIFFGKAAVEAYTSRKLKLITGATADEDRMQLAEDMKDLEEILANSTTEGVQLSALLQGALNPKGGEKGESGADEDGGPQEGEMGESQGGADGTGDLKQDNDLIEDLTLYDVSEKVAHLQRIFDKAAGECEERASLTNFIEMELSRMFSRVERATELSFESFDRGDTPHVANIKDLLDAKRKIKEARVRFQIGGGSDVTGGLGDRLVQDDDMLPIVFPGSPRSPRGDKRPSSPRSSGSQYANLVVGKISLAVSSRLPQISAVMFENQLRFLYNQVVADGPGYGVLAVKALSKDLPAFLRSENLLSFHTVANPPIKAASIAEILPTLERACSAAALESLLVRVNADKAEKHKSEARKEERVSSVMGHFADARGLQRNCGAYFKSTGDLTSEWLEESHALLFSAMFVPSLQPVAILAVYEYSSLVIFFAAVAFNTDVEVTYEHAADWFGAIFM